MVISNYSISSQNKGNKTKIKSFLGAKSHVWRLFKGISISRGTLVSCSVLHGCISVWLFAFGSAQAPSWRAYIVEPGPAHPASQAILLAGFHRETLTRSWRGKDRETLSFYHAQVPVVSLAETVAFLSLQLWLRQPMASTDTTKV